ncbi:ankyrin repeat domain-containing protein [Pseudarthrobacter sp. NPDC058196]|uniref:ankyrin repeat domain-containing protein n=1 Tax=Pseudarthrobacter sp. NPDC058196 TaxID=3346376 RepID=UPI0036DD2A2C
MDRAGRSPLHYAALANDVDEVRRLVTDVEFVDAADNQGFTPLHLASREDAVDAAAALLDLGATVDPINAFGNTPLFVAVFNSRGRPARSTRDDRSAAFTRRRSPACKSVRANACRAGQTDRQP